MHPTRNRQTLQSSRRRRSMAVNIVLELLDDELLLADDRFDKIANRDNTDHLLVVEDGQVAHRLRGHHSHTFADGLIGPRTDDLG